MSADDAFIRRTANGAHRAPMRFVSLSLLALIPGAAHADTVRLSPADAEAAIEAGAARNAQSPETIIDAPEIDRGVHGELGVGVGTGGDRSVYGVVGMPVGDSGSLVLGYSRERGHAYWSGRGGCRGVDATLCSWRISAQQLDALR